MNHDAIDQLAEVGHQDLTTHATTYRPTRGHRMTTSARSRRYLRRPLTAFRRWLAAGQL